MLGIARISLCIIYFFIQNTRFKSFLTFNMVYDLFKLTMRELWYDIEQDFLWLHISYYRCTYSTDE